MINLFFSVLRETWHFLLESSPYVFFGLLISGLLKIFLSPNAVARHLGQGRLKSVFKAAFLGIPIPLCSCGVLPAAVSLKKQGANPGATTAFLISTPESGADSIALTYALMDPLMTLARPLAAFFTATFAGLAENALGPDRPDRSFTPDLSCPIDGCCDGNNCSPSEHRTHHSLGEKLVAGVKYSLKEVWGDMVPWFIFGLILAGLITTLIPDHVMVRHLGGGLPSMLLMLVLGIPLYICATGSTPIAASLILKGVSPGAALVFLMVGPATNITSLTVLFGTMGKRATTVYLVSIALWAVIFGMALDHVYEALGLSARAMAGEGAEFIPLWCQWAAALILLSLSIRPVYLSIRNRIGGLTDRLKNNHREFEAPATRNPAERLSSADPG